MIFRQLFDQVSSTYTYLLASRPGGEALIIDPVIEKVDRYLQLLNELDLRLVKAVDTHCHADHISGLGRLRDTTRCITVMGKATEVDMVSMRVDDGDRIEVENIALDVMYTPGHTDDSYCFRMADRVFTGDTLLIRGTGRTDFQSGDPREAYRSIFGKLLKLPDETLVFPGHDYKGDTVSSIGEEKAYNPRLKVDSADAYAEIMDNLNLPNPKMMDQAVPANLSIGYKASADPAVLAATLQAEPVLAEMQSGAAPLFIDLRENNERCRDGIIPDSVHVPYVDFKDAIAPDGLLAAMIRDGGRPVLLYCAYGERSALALKDLFEAGFEDATHLAGGIDAWKSAGGALRYPE